MEGGSRAGLSISKCASAAFIRINGCSVNPRLCTLEAAEEQQQQTLELSCSLSLSPSLRVPVITGCLGMPAAPREKRRKEGARIGSLF